MNSVITNARWQNVRAAGVAIYKNNNTSHITTLNMDLVQKCYRSSCLPNIYWRYLCFTLRGGFYRFWYLSIKIGSVSRIT